MKSLFPYLLTGSLAFLISIANAKDPSNSIPNRNHIKTPRDTSMGPDSVFYKKMILIRNFSKEQDPADTNSSGEEAQSFPEAKPFLNYYFMNRAEVMSLNDYELEYKGMLQEAPPFAFRKKGKVRRDQPIKMVVHFEFKKRNSAPRINNSSRDPQEVELRTMAILNVVGGKFIPLWKNDYPSSPKVGKMESWASNVVKQTRSPFEKIDTSTPYDANNFLHQNIADIHYNISLKPTYNFEIMFKFGQVIQPNQVLPLPDHFELDVATYFKLNDPLEAPFNTDPQIRIYDSLGRNRSSAAMTQVVVLNE